MTLAGVTVMLEIVGTAVSFVMTVLALPISPTSFLIQVYTVFAPSDSDQADTMESTVTPVAYALQSVMMVHAEQDPLPFITTLYVPDLSPEKDTVEFWLETMEGLVLDIVTTGATGLATVRTVSIFLSSSSNVVLTSIGLVRLLFSSFAVKSV